MWLQVPWHVLQEEFDKGAWNVQVDMQLFSFVLQTRKNKFIDMCAICLCETKKLRVVMSFHTYGKQIVFK